ncbi:hypothetical protein [Aestuariivirga litoralis]|uniref:hypothetical protein n=1 Tax=Aestuariivirga litoralis TaxID=2650924 RepID=UPI0018C76F24|nr:hypothetical protein [Aestuariivirga litoralis]MBG1232977.1 hypothetical protein [Aestuariivirga litoralis]
MKTGIANSLVVAGPQNTLFQPGEKVTGDDEQMLAFAALGQVTLDVEAAPAAQPQRERAKPADAS